jgi:hypothetical protein
MNANLMRGKAIPGSGTSISGSGGAILGPDMRSIASRLQPYCGEAVQKHWDRAGTGRDKAGRSQRKMMQKQDDSETR